MEQTWRWFGPQDRVSLSDVAQAGATGIVSALHHVPTGAVWTSDEIARRQQEVARLPDGAPSGLRWSVVESLPVSEDIKKAKGAWKEHIAAYRDSLRNLADAGLQVICYNFMPILDWTRTDLSWRLPNGATCMRFDLTDFAAFDLFILKRPGAEADYDDALQDAAARRRSGMSDEAAEQLAANIVCGLPGAAEHFTLEDTRRPRGLNIWILIHMFKIMDPDQ